MMFPTLGQRRERQIEDARRREAARLVRKAGHAKHATFLAQLADPVARAVVDMHGPDEQDGITYRPLECHSCCSGYTECEPVAWPCPTWNAAHDAWLRGDI